MINIIDTDIYDENVITMNQMKPLQVGIILETKEYVLRTASVDTFEVINLSNPGKDECWEQLTTLDVRLLGHGEVVVICLTNDEYPRKHK